MGDFKSTLVCSPSDPLEPLFPTFPSTPVPRVDEVPAKGLPDHGVTDVGAPSKDGRAKRDLGQGMRFHG